MKIGDKLYLVDIGNRARHQGGTQRECEIVNIGRKYFTVSYGGIYGCDVRFYIIDWRQKAKYSAGYKLYKSRQEYEDEMEHGYILGRFRDVFQYTPRQKFTLDALKQAAEVLGIVIDDWKEN